MKLKPIVASYSGGYKIRQFLTDDVLDVIASVARSPRPKKDIALDVLNELEQMHVLIEQDAWVKLNTAVFLKDDMEKVLETIAPFANELAERVQQCGRAFATTTAEITIFLGGIIGLVQGLGMSLNQKDPGIWEWKRYTGKYPRSKVDFDELCDVYDALGPDVLNKTVLPGERYTAVFIGPPGTNFETLAYTGASDQNKEYLAHLNRYLVDSFATLVTGGIRSASLQAAAEAAKIYSHGKPRSAVIDNECMREYEGAVQAIIEEAFSYYIGKQQIFDELLRTTTSGRQGVSPANMAMHLWRYIRKVTAKGLYANGFFRDTIPAEGCLTVFYENDVPLLRKLLM